MRPRPTTEQFLLPAHAYDERGQKVAEWGSAVQPAAYEYDDAGRLTALDLLTDTTKHTILWDPTQPTTTRPLSIQKDDTYYTYGWDLTKNICELYNNTGYILNLYSYTPYGLVTANSEVDQPIQWSSESYDDELELVYYNYRYYNPEEGRWLARDMVDSGELNNLYMYCMNLPVYYTDYAGLITIIVHGTYALTQSWWTSKGSFAKEIDSVVGDVWKVS